MTIDRDHTIAEAIASLPLPEHDAGFWDELHQRLADERPPGSITLDAPAPPVRVLELPRTHTRRPARVRVAAVAALAVVALIAAIAVIGTHDERAHVPAAQPGQESSASTSTSTPLSADDTTARDAAAAWIDELARGDMSGAWAQLGPASKDAWGNSYSAFAAAQTSFEETFTSWATATNRRVSVATVARWGSDPLHAVTFTGERDINGTHHDDALALIVRDTANGHEIEPFTPHGTIGLHVVHPTTSDTPATAERTDAVVFGAPEAVTGFSVVVDTGQEAAVVPVHTEGGDTQFSYLPTGGWTPGRHVITAVTTYGDGTPAAVTVILDIR